MFVSVVACLRATAWRFHKISTYLQLKQKSEATKNLIDLYFNL